MDSGKDFEIFLTLYPQEDGVSQVVNMMKETVLHVTKNLVNSNRMFEKDLRSNIDGLTRILAKKYEENKISPYSAFYAMANHRMNMAYSFACDLLVQKKAFMKRVGEDTPQGSKIVTVEMGQTLGLMIEKGQEKLECQLKEGMNKLVEHFVNVEKEIPDILTIDYEKVKYAMNIDPRVAYIMLQYHVSSEAHHICASMLETAEANPRIVPAQIVPWCFKD